MLYGSRLNKLASGVKQFLSEAAVGSSEPGLSLDFTGESYRASGSSQPFNQAVTHSRSGNATMTDGYGHELVANGGFDTDLTGWTAGSVSYLSGAASWDAGNGSIYQSGLSISTSKSYVVSFNASVASGSVILRFGGLGANDLVVSATGSYETILVPDGASIGFYGLSFVGSIDNVSVREMPAIKWAPHNLLPYSEDFSNAAWTKISGGTGSTPVVTSNAAVAPDGSMTADRVVASISAGTTAADYSLVRQSPTFNDITEGNSVYAVWLKSNTGSSQTITTSYNGTPATVVVTNEWQLFEVTPNVGGTGNHECDIGVKGGVTDQSCDVLVWGAHLYRSDLGGMVDNPERGDSYVPTTSAAAYLPRIGHHEFNGYEWVNKGLLAESEARTNLFTSSNSFDVSPWTDTGNLGTVSQTDTGPDGGVSASTVIDNGATGTGAVHIGAQVTVSTSTAYTFSVYAKADQLSWMELYTLQFTTPGNGGTYFDLSSGSVGTSFAGHAASIEDVGNGWYRCSITFTTDAADTVGSVRIRLANGDADSTVDLDGTSSILIYGAQFEAGSVPSSYIPTSGATATRAAETFTVPAANLPWPQPEYAVSEFGPELVTNGGFDTDSDWVKSSTATISGGVGNIVSDGSYQYLAQSTILEIGKVYKVTYEVTQATSGYLKSSSSFNLNSIPSAVGTHSFNAVATGASLYFERGSACDISIDNVSVRELTSELVTNGGFDTDSDWTKGTGWTISGGVASFAPGGTDTIRQDIGLVSGTLYAITYTVSGRTAGTVKAVAGGDVSGELRSADGTYTDYLVSGANALLYLQPDASFDGSIDNVSVREINPLSVSIAMKGEMDYADNNTAGSTSGKIGEAVFAEWWYDASNFIELINTTNTGTGKFVTNQKAATIIDNVVSSELFTPGLNVPFDIASRHGSTFLNGAVDGVALTANTTPTALPDLSATDLDLAYDFMGTIESFRVWDQDLGDSGIEEASAPSLEPSLNLTFDGSGLSFTDTGWTP